MSTAESWGLVVPEDDAELGAELRRHGVRPGQLLWVVEPDENQTVDREHWRLAILQALTATVALSSINDAAAKELRSAVEPHLDALQAIVAQTSTSMPRIELSEASRTALAALTAALNQAFHASGLQDSTAPDSTEPERPRRRLRFTGALKDAEPDLSARTDEYLARGFGRE